MKGRGFYEAIDARIAAMYSNGFYKRELRLSSPQSTCVRAGEREMINLCANNYLGLANDPRVVRGAIEAVERWGAGTASVRFICGTLDVHRELEEATARYLGMEDAVLFAAAFDANGGLFECLLGEEDAIVSDGLNHASIIDGIRLSKARRFRFENGDMTLLEDRVASARAAGARTVMIATDGVFSMDGHVAKLSEIVEIADRHDAIVMVDDCHATGILGPNGRGSAALHGVADRVDIITGTYGKALGGAMGGFVAARAPVVALLRQRARPYLFSNALAPAVCGAALAALKIVDGTEGDALRDKLAVNVARFRAAATTAGFTLLPGAHPITPIIVGDAASAQRFSFELANLGILASAFFYPVVPRSLARIRIQITSDLTFDLIDRSVNIMAETISLINSRQYN